LCYYSHTWAVQLIRGVFHWDFFFICWSSQSYSVFSGLLIAEEVGAVGDKGSEGTTTVDVRTLLEAFFNVSLRSACFIDEAFSQVKSKTSSLGTTLLKCHIIRISELFDIR
jgi:hypothetical protein